MIKNELSLKSDGSNNLSDENVLRRRFKESPKEKLLAQHRVWLASVQHEYPMPYTPYRIGVYIRFFNQTKYRDEEYLKRHKQLFAEDIALCPKWTLVDFYVDYGSKAPHMESEKEWCRLLADCITGKVNLIVTQKASNVSDDPQELTFISRILAAQNPPIGIYFVSDDIFTLASYYKPDINDRTMLPDGWKVLPLDELDAPMCSENEQAHLEAGNKEGQSVLLMAKTGNASNSMQEGENDAGTSQ